jgi:hypothetical protein
MQRTSKMASLFVASRFRDGRINFLAIIQPPLLPHFCVLMNLPVRHHIPNSTQQTCTNTVHKHMIFKIALSLN